MSLDSVLKSGLTSGLTAGLTQWAGQVLANGTLTGAQQVGNTLKAAQTATDLTDKLVGYTVRAGISASVNQAVYGKGAGSFGQAFVNSFVASASADAAKFIGDNTGLGKPLGEMGSPGYLLAHAALGCAAAALSGHDCAAGAIGGGMSAFAGSLLPDPVNQTQRALMAGGLTFIGGATAQAAGYDGVTAAQAATNEAVNNRQLHRDERRLAARLARESGGRYTQAEIEDAMRLLGNREKGETVATGMVVKVSNWEKEIYDSRAKWRAGEDGQSLIQVLPEVDAELIAYVQRQTGGWESPYAPRLYVLPPAPAKADQPRDRLTGLPLDERGRYSTKVVVDGKVYEPKYWTCATAECLTRNANLDTTDPATQAYLGALDKKTLDDVGMASAVVALVNPLGAVGAVAGATGTGTSYAKGMIDGDLVSPTIATASSEGAKNILNTFGSCRQLRLHG
ncbi:MAG: DUF637 domain-containing protein [Burkholderiales bacterium]|nr:DUF637 domain-containing protein [Burkholderiales bacterium]